LLSLNNFFKTYGFAAGSKSFFSKHTVLLLAQSLFDLTFFLSLLVNTVFAQKTPNVALRLSPLMNIFFGIMVSSKV